MASFYRDIDEVIDAIYSSITENKNQTTYIQRYDLRNILEDYGRDCSEGAVEAACCECHWERNHPSVKNV